MRPSALVALALLACAAACGRARVPPPGPPVASTCAPAGRWIDPSTGFAVPFQEVVAGAAAARIVLLGEDHDDPAVHRWQLHTIAAIAGTVPVALGLEMLPRRAQPALDRWVAGVTTRETFLAESDWRRTWGFAPDLYWPILDFARMHRTPVVALNVERSLVGRVAAVGWANVPSDAREGVSTPAPASPAYRDALSQAWHAHAGSHDDPAAFERFVEAQLTWDRAMAEALRHAVAANPGRTVAALLGRGHVEHGFGVPAQLAALGETPPRVLVAWQPARDCAQLVPGVADAVFGLDGALDE